MFRRLFGYTQNQVAIILNVPASTVSKWEAGLISPKIEQLKALAKLYRTLIDNLYPDLDPLEQYPLLRDTVNK